MRKNQKFALPLHVIYSINVINYNMHIPRVYFGVYRERTLKNRNDLGFDKADEYITSSTANLVQ